MILFQNVYITDTHAKGVGAFQNREQARNFDKLDIYKYSLASISKIYPWSKVIICTKLDSNYAHRRDELNDFIKQEFGSYNLIIRDERNETQKQWQDDFELLDDNLIWFCGNHDHVFIDYEYSYFNYFVNFFKDKTGPFSLQFSHWPEFIFDPFYNNVQAEFFENFIKMNGKFHHSLQIISKDLYKYYWFDTELPKDQIWGRTDNFFSDVFHKEIETFVAMREFCRHFDGYQHCARPYANDLVPVLEIPLGFFENDIKINYGPNYANGFNNLNPNAELRIYDKFGTDYWYSKKYIPAFWKSRITKFYDNFETLTTEDELNQKYINRQLGLLGFIPNELLKNIITETYSF